MSILDPSKKDPPPRMMYYTSLFLLTTNYKIVTQQVINRMLKID